MQQDLVFKLKKLGAVMEELYYVNESNVETTSKFLIDYLETSPEYLPNIILAMYRVSIRRFNIGIHLAEILSNIAKHKSEFSDEISNTLSKNLRFEYFYFLHFCLRKNLVRLGQLKVCIEDFLSDNNAWNFDSTMFYYLGYFFREKETEFYKRHSEKVKNYYSYSSIHTRICNIFNDQNNYFHTVVYGDRPNEFRSIVLSDDLDAFIKYTSDKNIPEILNQNFKPLIASPYQHSNALYLIAFAKSTKIFTHLLLVYPDVVKHIDKTTIDGGCLEIMKHFDHFDKDALHRAYLSHHMDIAEWIQERIERDASEIENNVAYSNYVSVAIENNIKIVSIWAACRYNSAEVLLYSLSRGDLITDEAHIDFVIQYDQYLVLKEILKQTAATRRMFAVAIVYRARNCYELLEKCDIDIEKYQYKDHSDEPDLNIINSPYQPLKDGYKYEHFYVLAYYKRFFYAFLKLCSKVTDWSDINVGIFEDAPKKYKRILEKHGAPKIPEKTYIYDDDPDLYT